ncbi:hypothetical protein [Saccharibacillus qingshengii]|uniref:hypothetical protein n=1 Tax=Saccharibacillus qingshengii TaxID=1763540 RepID=UPI001555480B|nr:hypothetical protein [Saccharibacillus qingshengii]
MIVLDFSKGGSAIGKFLLGKILVTEGVLKSVSETDQMIALNRHAQGDWGTVFENEALTNNKGMLKGGRLLSSYLSERGIPFDVVTEANRSLTWLKLREE